MPYGDMDLGQHWLMWWIIAITGTYVEKSSVRSCGVQKGGISLEIFKTSRLDMSLKITNLKLQPHLPRVCELNSERVKGQGVIGKQSKLMFSLISFIYSLINSFYPMSYTSSTFVVLKSFCKSYIFIFIFIILNISWVFEILPQRRQESIYPA